MYVFFPSLIRTDVDAFQKGVALPAVAAINLHVYTAAPNGISSPQKRLIMTANISIWGARSHEIRVLVGSVLNNP